MSRTSKDAPRCRHCRAPIPPTAGSSHYCCSGCEGVQRLLLDAGLERYYELAGSQVTAPAAGQPPTSHAWLEPLLETAEAGSGDALCALDLDVQGVHCAACVWLLNETFRRRGGGNGLTVNPALGKVRLVWARGQFAARDWVQEVERFGYQFGPARKTSSRSSIDLPLRLGICAALAVNVMLFSVSFYFGLKPTGSIDDRAVFGLFTILSLVLSSAVVAIGGWPFFKSAWRSLESGVLHLDLPIAAGILAVYGISLAQLRHGRGDTAYFDTLNVFICLMLLGRLLQDRVLERNRRYLLEDDGADGIMVRVVHGERVELRRAPQVKAGDRLLVAPGDLVPVTATLLDRSASIRTDWITGESDARELEAGGAIPAGSFNAGSNAFHATAATAFADSPLVALLRQPQPRRQRPSAHQRAWNRLARGWVLGVLVLATVGFAVWLPQGVDRAINVAAALLVVTCPCAIGIAIPLAYELTQASLRRQGFFVRSSDLLDRLPRVRRLLFDKTGTLTLGRLELLDPEALGRLSATQRDVAYNLAARSAHPASACVAAALAGFDVRYDAAAEIAERPGRGVEWLRADGCWRLGRGDWAADVDRELTVLARDGELVATLETREALRPDAARQIGALSAAGYESWLLSGDGAERVEALARRLEIPAERAFSRLVPEAKARAVEALDHDDTLFLGDGVNDALAFERAFVAGTPAIDRPVMPAKSDFFIVGEGLRPLGDALAASLRLQHVVRGLLLSALVYNTFAIGLCLAGRMSPLLAAVLMPSSTLFLLTRTAWSLAAPSDRDAAPTGVIRTAEAES